MFSYYSLRLQPPPFHTACPFDSLIGSEQSRRQEVLVRRSTLHRVTLSARPNPDTLRYLSYSSPSLLINARALVYSSAVVPQQKGC